MSLNQLLLDINDESKTILSPAFTTDVTQAYILPSVDDQDITFENFDDKTKKVKWVETCVLHIDLRQSTQLNLEQNPQTLAKLYSCFIRGTIKCAEYWGGKVRNIAGDRVMILFDPKDCFKNAVNAAILLHTFSKFILRHHFRTAIIECGIGIDYGKMLATKVGTIRRGTETSGGESKTLVWLGRPANVASKLADIANKTFSRLKIAVGYYYPFTNQFSEYEEEVVDFFDKVRMTGSYPIVAQLEPYAYTFGKKLVSYGYQPILMTKSVFDGFKAACPTDKSVAEKWWKARSVNVGGYTGVIYEGDVIFTFGQQLQQAR